MVLLFPFLDRHAEAGLAAAATKMTKKRIAAAIFPQCCPDGDALVSILRTSKASRLGSPVGRCIILDVMRGQSVWVSTIH